MSIAMVCPGCGKQYAVPDKLRGKAARCHCGTTLHVPAAAQAPPEPAPQSSWLADELDAIQRAQEQKVAEPTPQAAYKSPRSDPLAGYRARGSADRGSTGRDLVMALIASGGIVLLALVFGGISIWYIGTHPVAGATANDRAAALGSGLGTLTGLVLGIPWIVVAVRYRNRQQ